VKPLFPNLVAGRASAGAEADEGTA
jgi:hypothetical protein